MAITTIRASRVSETQNGLKVEVVMADSADLEEATEAIQIQVVVKGALFWPLATIQKEALSRARDAINDEIQRMKQSADRFSD